MNLVKKALLYIKADGFRKTAIRSASWIIKRAKYFPSICKEQICRSRYIREIAQHVEGKELYLLCYSFDWNASLFQRPHHLAEVLSRRKNAHVIFASEQSRFDNFAGLITISPHLDAVPLRFLLKNPEMLQGAKHTTVFQSMPFQVEMVKTMPYDTLVYDYIDDLSLNPYCTEQMEMTHRRLMETADLTVCTAKALYCNAAPYAKKVIFSPNACDYNFFRNNRSCKCDKAVAERIKQYDCVLGYYGCLANWFDYELILQIAERKPNWCFLLIGQCFDRSDQCLRESGLPNIILWPAQPYKELPHFTAAFHIQIIPFRINKITIGTSPVKLFEYMAAGKPILTSALPECMQYQSVEIYDTAEDFIAKAEKLQTLSPDSGYWKTMEQEARENTWEARVEEILENIEGCDTDE